MKSGLISLQRRQLMLAGAAAAVVPAFWFAASRSARAANATPAAARLATGMVVSGRLTTANGQPLAGATINMSHLFSRIDGNDSCTATSDADGRFVITTAVPKASGKGLQPMNAKVRHPAYSAQYAFVVFEPRPEFRDASSIKPTILAETLLDQDILRASFGLTIS